jgi:integrase
LGYACPSCKTLPNRFRVDIHFSGNRYFICSDKQGQALDTYQRSLILLSHIQHEIDNHIFDPSKYVASDIQRFYFENLLDTWIADKEKETEKGQLSYSYVKPLKGHIENYIKPYFKGKDIRDIRTIDIKEFYRQLPDKLSPKTQKNIVNALENFFNTLLSDEILEKKPVFPKISVPEPAIKWCNREVQDSILNAIPDKHRFIFFFLTRQGLRPAEAVAIRWEDIDLTNGILTVKRTMSYRKIVERTKTKKVRPRLIHPEVLDILKSVPRGLPNVYLFINPNSKKPYLTDTLQRLWKEACKVVNVDIELYQATRHSVASMAASSGVSIAIIKEVLGHTDIRTTQKYSHVNVLSQSQVFAAQGKLIERHRKNDFK